MYKKNIEFSYTQSNLKKYLEEKLKLNERVVAFYSDNHFGAETVIQNFSFKSKVISFEDLLQMSHFSLIKVLASFFVSVITAILTIILKINIQASVNNAVNSTLEITKKKFYTYRAVLRYTKRRRKYRRIRKIIYIKDFEHLDSLQLQKFRMLMKDIQERHITKTILIITSKSHGSQLLSRELSALSLPSFGLSKEDILWFAQKNNITDINITDSDVNLIGVLGLDFFQKYYKDIIDCTNNTVLISEHFQRIENLLQRILNQAEIQLEIQKEIIPLLNFVSVFNKFFTSLEVANYENNALHTKNFDVALNLSILKQDTEKRISFNKEIFKEYYYEQYKRSLFPTPKNIFNYINQYIPFEYLTLIRLFEIDITVCEINQQLSILLKAYFFSLFFSNMEDKEKVIKYIEGKRNIAENLFCGIDCYENFMSGSEINVDSLKKFADYIFEANIDYTAKCIGLFLILQVSKERIKQWERYHECLDQLKNILIDFDSNSDMESKYWNFYFKELFIAFSLETEKIDFKTIELFKKEIEEINCDTSMNFFIVNHKYLRKLNRITLLSSNIMPFEKTEKNLINFISSENSMHILQLAIINLSVYYIENLEWKSSYNILKAIDEDYIKIINTDTKLAFENNNLLVKYFCKKVTPKSYINKLKDKLINEISSSEIDIVKNNYIAAMIENNENYDDIISEISEVLNNCNDYSRFYANNNLLYIYFITNNITEFEKVEKDILNHFPELLRKYESFFQRKYSYIKKHWGEKNLKEVKIDTNPMPPIPKMYYRLIMFGGIERWFE